MAIVGNLVVNVIADTRSLSAGLNRASTHIKMFGSIGGRVTSMASTIMVKALATAAKAVVSWYQTLYTYMAKAVKTLAVGSVMLRGYIGVTGAVFEQNLAKVKAYANLTDSETSQLTDKAIELGRITEQTTAQVGEAMAMLARNGMKFNEIMEMTPAVLQLATAGSLDMATAADIASKAMRGMRLSADDMTRVTDVLAYAASNSAGTVQDMGHALRYAAAISADLNVPLETTVGALMTLTDAGLEASIAGTSLRNVFNRLTSPAAAGAREIRSLGIEVADSNGNLRPFVDILADLKKQLDGMGDVERNSVLKKIFEVRGQAAAANLIEYLDRLKEKIDGLMNAKGTGKRIQEELLKTTFGQFTLMLSEFDSLEKQIYKIDSPKLNSLIQFVTLWTKANRNTIVEGVTNLFNMMDTTVINMINQLTLFLANPQVWLSKWSEAIGKLLAAMGEWFLGVGFDLGKVFAAGMLQALANASPVLMSLLGVESERSASVKPSDIDMPTLSNSFGYVPPAKKPPDNRTLLQKTMQDAVTNIPQRTDKMIKDMRDATSGMGLMNNAEATALLKQINDKLATQNRLLGGAASVGN